MRVLSVVSFVISALIASVAADDLQIIKTKEVTCTRKTKVSDSKIYAIVHGILSRIEILIFSISIQEGDNIIVNYRGTLESTGEQFDSSYDRSQPFNFQLGAGRVIKGWDLGLLDMCIGEERKLIIPYQLGYGERGMPPVIPPSSTLSKLFLSCWFFIEIFFGPMADSN